MMFKFDCFRSMYFSLSAYIVEINYAPNEVASQCMKIYHHFCSKFSGRSHDEIMRLIARDIGDEFDLGKDETLKILEFLIDQN